MMVAVALGEAKVVGGSASMAMVTRGEDGSRAAWQCDPTQVSTPQHLVQSSPRC